MNEKTQKALEKLLDKYPEMFRLLFSHFRALSDDRESVGNEIADFLEVAGVVMDAFLETEVQKEFILASIFPPLGASLRPLSWARSSETERILPFESIEFTAENPGPHQMTVISDFHLRTPKVVTTVTRRGDSENISLRVDGLYVGTTNQIAENHVVPIEMFNPGSSGIPIASVIIPRVRIRLDVSAHPTPKNGQHIHVGACLIGSTLGYK